MAKCGVMMVNNIGKYIDKKALLIQNGFPCGNWNENGIGILQLRPFNVSNLGLIDLNQKKYIEIEKNIKTYQVRYNDIIFTNTNSEILVGRTALWKSNENCVLSNHMSIIRVLNKEELSPSFLAHFLHYQWISGFSKSICRRHVNQASIGIDKLKALELPEYSISEQQNIAHVLSTVQKAIEQQDNLIRTTTELKKALMQKLFTEGTRGEPQKQTEIGLVPESWVVMRIGDIMKITSGGTPSRKNKEYYEGDILWVKSGELEDNIIQNTEEKITEQAIKDSSAKLFPSKTLLIAMYGATVGKTSILEKEAATNQAVCTILPNEEIFNQEFLRHYFITIRENLLKQRYGGAQPNISQTIIKNTLVPKPNIKEQNAIADSMILFDSKICYHKCRKDSLTTLFKTLLHELMTGQRRVHELEFEALQSKTLQQNIDNKPQMSADKQPQAQL